MNQVVNLDQTFKVKEDIISMKYIFLILGTYGYSYSHLITTEGSGLGPNDQRETTNRQIPYPEGNDTSQNAFDGIIPVVFASEKEPILKIKKFIIKIDPHDPLYKKIKLIRLVFSLLSFYWLKIQSLN